MNQQNDAAQVRPFQIAIPEHDLSDLRERLARTRWPDAVRGDWKDGMDLAALREVVDYWQHSFNWRAQEARLNTFAQALVRVEGGDVHVLHRRGTGPAPFPLVVTPGWPGSFVEMLELTERLSDPARFGGDAADAFDVVVPSLPGYGFSSRPAAPGTTPSVIAARWVAVMAALGYDRFGAQGGDWGSAISALLGLDHAEHLAGVHLNFVMQTLLPSRRELGERLAPEELAYFERLERWNKREGGYAHEQGTKPQTLAYGLNDSPAGLAAWIAEKFRAWSGDGTVSFSHDTLLTNISIYWFTQTIGSSMRLYWERAHEAATPKPEHPRVPFGFANFPGEFGMPPRALLERTFGPGHYTTMPRGGHFAALEEPALLAADIATFFRPLR